MRRFGAPVALALAVAAAPAPLRAQDVPELVDRIVAVVGERAILLSEIDEEILQQQAQGLQVPEDSAGRAALRRQVLERLIDDEVLYQRARRDTTVTVTDAEVQSGVEEQVRRVRARFSSDAEFRAQLQTAGWGTPEEYRRWFAEQQRRSEYQRRFLDRQRQEGKLRPGTVSEEELRRAFEEAQRQPGGVRQRPPTISYRQIVVTPRPTDAARQAARVRAESALAELQRGADFATLARRLSDDATTRELGGDLNWFRRGTMVREFEEVAFRLRPGQASPIVPTAFGYHIIQVDRVQPAEIKARHILFMPAVAEAELAAARRTADSIAVLLSAGAAGFDSLAALYGDTAAPRTVGPVERSQLPAPYRDAFEGAAVGQVIAPFAVNPETPARSQYVVAELTDAQPERPFRFEEVRDQIRQNLQQERAIRELLASLRRQTYVDIRL
ncbi:MAG: peptidylprolyl isomerase [Gemmatimonadetes bacterium]|nr:peptidylprolyl isomerase [Gemmatimonadota bacterium]